MKVKRFIFALGGSLLLVLAAIGLVMPLLPTTPLVLLAAGCFSASSPKIHARLQKSRIFGPFIENYRTKQGIPLILKAGSIAFLWLGLITSMVVLNMAWAYLLLGLVGVGVTVHLLLIKTKRE